MRRLALLCLVAACQAPAIVHRATPSPPSPAVSPTAPVSASIPAPIDDPPRDAGPPALAGEPIQTWRVGDFDVVASLPIGTRARRPVVVGIHGSRDRPDAACTRWRRTLAAYAFVVCPEGMPYRHGLAWGSPAVIAERIDGALAALRARYGAFVADGPVVYAGWSLGATRGPSVVALRPGLFDPVVLAEIGHTRLDAAASAKALRTGKSTHTIVACATKRCATFVKRLASAKGAPSVAFVDAGIGRGHLFDDRMARTIGAAVARVVESDPRWSGLAAALEAAPPDSDAGAPLSDEDDDAG